MNRENMPIFAIMAAVVLVLAAIVGIIFVPPTNNGQLILVVGLILTSVPTLIAAAFSERVSRDVRNGVLEKKVKNGTMAALDESGVTSVAQAVDPQASTQALTTAVTALHSLLVQVNSDNKGNGNGADK